MTYSTPELVRDAIFAIAVLMALAVLTMLVIGLWLLCRMIWIAIFDRG